MDSRYYPEVNEEEEEPEDEGKGLSRWHVSHQWGLKRAGLRWLTGGQLVCTFALGDKPHSSWVLPYRRYLRGCSKTSDHESHTLGHMFANGSGPELWELTRAHPVHYVFCGAHPRPRGGAQRGFDFQPTREARLGSLLNLWVTWGGAFHTACLSGFFCWCPLSPLQEE